MILIIYKRAGCIDMRCFKDREELNEWIRNMHELGEEFHITHIEYK